MLQDPPVASCKRAAAVVTQRLMGSTVVALAAALSLSHAHAAAADYTIDSAHTLVTFKARGFGILRLRGEFATTVGSVSLDPQIGDGRFDILIDAGSVEADDGAVEQVMRSKALLNVEQYPTIVYAGKRVTFANDKPVLIEGQLTLLGITSSVPLTVTDYGCAPMDATVERRCTIEATATFKRSTFGMSGYGALIGDNIELAIEAEAVATQPGDVH